MATAARKPAPRRAATVAPNKAPSAKAPPAKAPVADVPAPIKPKAAKTGDDAKKAKRIRGDFAMPEADYARIAKLKATAKRGGVKVKKNELLRLGLRALQSLPSTELVDQILSMRLPEVKRRAKKPVE